MSSYKNFAYVITLALAIACVAAETVAEDDYECPLMCPAIFAPVCATDGDSYSQFDNACELKANNCQRQRSLLKPLVETDTAWCTSDYEENLMEKLSNLDLEHSNCLKPCPMIYAPVCISNGKYRGVIANDCVMDMINCAIEISDKSAEIFKVLKNHSC